MLRPRSIVMFLVVLIPLLAACGGPNAETGTTFLEALSDGRPSSAKAQVCADKEDTLPEEFQEAVAFIPEGEDAMGLKSPGLKDISCTAKEKDIECSFAAPVMHCEGNILGGGTMSCTSWEPNGKQVKVLFTLDGGKICGYDIQ